MDRVQEAEAELAPVFVALESAAAEARQLRENGQVDAERRRRQGGDEAARIVAEANSRLDAVRSLAATARLATLDEQRAKLEADARAEAERVRLVANAKVGEVVADVVAGVWATAGVLPAPSSNIFHDEVPR